jgi:hypothetical protein
MLPDLGRNTRWRKSSASGGEGGECIELHPHGAVRDSKNPIGGHLEVPLSGLVAVAKAYEPTR